MIRFIKDLAEATGAAALFFCPFIVYFMDMTK